MNLSAEAQLFETDLGLKLETENFLCLFGNINCDLEQLKESYPQFKFLRVRQTHSDIIIPAEYRPDTVYENLTEADAHFTSEKNQALLISTADCMPILIYCEQTQRVAAVHAGWRGVVNKITEKTLKKLIETGSTKKYFEIYVGPSIQQPSFEVDQDVYEQIKSSAYNLTEDHFCEKKAEKYHLNLPKILSTQIGAQAPTSKVVFCPIDTKTNPNFHSYRRGKQKPQRNLSLIALK